MRIGSARLMALFPTLLITLAASVEAADEPIAAQLDSLRLRQAWGEVTFEGGRLRQVRVDSVSSDEVFLREVIGPLQVRPATYALTDIRSVRDLGPRRLQQHVAPYQRARSVPITLGLELLIPGAGYFYAGEPALGWRVLFASAALAAAAVSTGADGAAAWIPLGTWLRVYSLGHLADEVRARQELQRRRAHLLSQGAASPPALVMVRWRF